jgi:hypothetical protein
MLKMLVDVLNFMGLVVLSRIIFFNFVRQVSVSFPGVVAEVEVEAGVLVSDIVLLY